MNQTIEDGVREGRIIELPVPVGHRQLTGYDHRASAEAVVEDLEEIATAGRIDRKRRSGPIPRSELTTRVFSERRER